MKHKPYLTIDEQIKLLSSDRGLIIDDINKAKEALLNLNYYRLSGYSLTLRKITNFIKVLTLMIYYKFITLTEI